MTRVGCVRLWGRKGCTLTSRSAPAATGSLHSCVHAAEGPESGCAGEAARLAAKAQVERCLTTLGALLADAAHWQACVDALLPNSDAPVALQQAAGTEEGGSKTAEAASGAEGAQPGASDAVEDYAAEDAAADLQTQPGVVWDVRG